jgi:hypothetical protein
MKKVIVMAFLFALVFGTVNVVVAKGNKDVTGEWKWEVPAAASGYQKGVLALNEKEGKLTGQAIYADGYKIELKDVKFTDGVLQFGIMVEYESYTIKAKISGKKLEGKVIHTQGEMEITGEKVK